MAISKHVEIVSQGVKVWNRWRKEHFQRRLDPTLEVWKRPDLSFADLGQRDLREIDLRSVNLGYTNFRGSDLRRARLGGARLHGAILQADLRVANFREALLDEADLNGANLGNADFHYSLLDRATFRGAELRGADMRGAKFGRCDLTEASIGYTVFGFSDLSAVEGLETVLHRGPSTIGIDTIYQSQGKIPDAFLRGAGIPEDFIVYMRSLTASAIEFYSCFISYSSRDQVFADRLRNDLQARGVRCWFAGHDVRAGQKLHDQIDRAIRLHEKLLLVLSAHSIGSEWVKTEIAKARKREVNEKRQMLFPVRLCSFEALNDWECFDADTGKDSAREIREYFIPDFSNWKNHDTYQEAFERLLTDLKAK